MLSDEYNIAADALRILSILAVIFIHTTTRTLEVSAFALQKIPFTLFLNQVFRFAVPLLFIISGFVLELSYHVNESYLTYLKKRLNRIFVPYVFWSAVYYFFVYYKNRNPNFLSSLLRGDASYQLYFIPALLIFYLIFPFIHKYLKIIGNVWVMILLFLVQLILLFYDYNVHPLPFFYPLTIATLNYFALIFGAVLSRNYDMFTNFMKLPDLTVGVSSPCCFVGSPIPPKQKLLRIHPRAYARGFLRRGINKWKWILILGTIISAYFVFHEGLNGYLITHNYLAFYSQWRPSVLIYTIFLGGTLYWLLEKIIHNASIVKAISRLSFFVFFIHIIILEMLWYLIGVKTFKLQFAQNLWWDPVFFTAVTLISFSIAFIAHKIPHLSKLTG